MAYKMKGPSLYKKPVGPIAEKKDLHNEAAIRTEGPEKIQTLRRKGLTPGSQTFIKKKTYPKSYTKEDIKFLEDQREDVVREEDKN